MGNEVNKKKAKKSTKRAKRNKKIKILTFAIEGVVLLGLIVTFLVLYYTGLFSKTSTDKDYVKNSVNDLSEETLEAMDGYTNIALFGLDTRTPGALGKGTRSDTIMVASINDKTGDIKICSVYRDSYLNLANDKYDKCNAAYAAGGPDQAVAMLNMNLDLNIQYYVSVDFTAVSEAIDELGGVMIDVDEYEIGHLNNYIEGTSEATGKTTTKLTSTGYQLLDGIQATSYCRIRYTAGDDFKRTERQREVLEAMFAKAKNMDITTVDAIIKKVFPLCATNMSLNAMLDLAVDALSYNIVETKGFPFDLENKKIDGAAMVVPVGLEQNVQQLHEFLFGETDYVPSAEVVKISDKIVDLSGVKPEETAE